MNEKALEVLDKELERLHESLLIADFQQRDKCLELIDKIITSLTTYNYFISSDSGISIG